MAQWRLSTQHNKSAETHTFMRKDEVQLKIIERFRQASVFLETDGDEPPEIDLKNPEGVNTYLIPDTEWELDAFEDGWDVEFEVTEGELSEQDLSALKEKFGEDGLYGVEESGWVDEGECEWWMFGPLQLEDEGGNVVAQGEPAPQG